MTNLMLCTILVTSLVHVSRVSALFEDQAGRFDWRQQYVGEASHVGYFSNSQTSVLVVATKSHVVAGLDADNGVIRWRHVFEQEEIGRVWDLHVSATSRHSVSVSGAELLFVRVWDSVTGALVVEHLARPGRVPDLVSVSANKLVTVFYDGGEMEIVTYSFDHKKLGEGEKVISRTPVQVGSVGGAVCGVTDTAALVCAAEKGLHTLDLGQGRRAAWQTHSVAGPVVSSSLRVRGAVAEVETAAGKVARLDTATGSLVTADTGAGVALVAGCGGAEVRQECATEGRSQDGLGYCDTYSRQVSLRTGAGAEVTHTLAEQRGRVEAAWAVCEDSDLVQVVLVMEDAALVSLTPAASTMFVREEGIASLQLVQMVGMGADTGKDEFDIHRIAHPGNFLDPAVLVKNFLSRIKRHAAQLQSLLLAVTDFRLGGQSKQTHGDKFGLRKVVVGVTSRGKIYAMESRKGTLLWQRMVPGRAKSLLIQRDGRSDIGEAQAMLVYRHRRSSYFTQVFNPVTGAVMSDDPCPLELDQALLLPETQGSDLPRPVLLVTILSLLPFVKYFYLFISFTLGWKGQQCDGAAQGRGAAPAGAGDAAAAAVRGDGAGGRGHRQPRHPDRGGRDPEPGVEHGRARGHRARHQDQEAGRGRAQRRQGPR